MMLRTSIVISAAILVLQASAATGQQPAPPPAVRAAEAQLVVFIKLGPNWEKRDGAMPVLLAHRDLYARLAERGDIIFSGRFAGQPALGMAVFDPDADGAAMRRLLEADRAVRDGYVTVEFRHFGVAFGALGRPAASAEGRPVDGS